MALVNLDEHCENIIDNPGRSNELVNIRVAQSRYTLEGYQHGYEVLMCSPDLNVFCDKILIQKLDDRHVVLPYLEDAKVRLYSKPTVIDIGFENPDGFGVVPVDNWEETMAQCGLDKKLIRAVRKYLAQHTAIDYDFQRDQTT